jgi:hypothetical protein
MTLEKPLRIVRAAIILTCAAAVTLSPAAAEAKPKKPAVAKKRAALKRTSPATEARGSAPASAIHVPAAVNTSGLGTSYGLGPSVQLAAMRTALNASAAHWAGHSTDCADVTPLLASQDGPVMAGNFRDSGGNCYVWLNLAHSDLLSGSEICKVTLHEMGHLNGLQHVGERDDVMFSPFDGNAIPAPCVAKAATQTRTAKTASHARVSICPPGSATEDYCETAAPRKQPRRQRRSGRA